MSYHLKRYLKMLELDKVLCELASLTGIPDATEAAEALMPCFNFSEVKRDLQRTDDAYVLTAKYAAPSFGRPENMNGVLARADVGAALSMRELLDIAGLLVIIARVRKWFDDCRDTGSGSLDGFFETLAPNKYLCDRITFAIKSEDEMNDNASPALSDLRRKIRQKSEKLRDSLEKIIRGGASKYLQEAIITQRDGRYVVPVKAEHKNEISGIVHDTSATGQTLFIEPMTVVEVNNDIRVLRLQEAEEINRILAELSAEVSGFSGSIRDSYEALSSLDLIFAKASLAYKMKASLPQLNSDGCVMLKNARHPLIDKKTVVPVSISLGREYDTLVITGPNTGGKTVSLKTLGLLSVMAMCGLFIPADEGSTVAVFDRIFVDIGDEQSIEQSLSTFSSHMVNIISVLEECNDNSLVLFDELCAGTDPVEGAALAKAILLRLSVIGAKTAATTHYPELKAYAIDTARVENASCEFDVNDLKPTYRLIIGAPGRSNAFAISGRLGLDEGIIEEAKLQIAEDDKRFERVVSSLESARQTAENERAEVSQLKAELAAAKLENEKKTAVLAAEREKLMSDARKKAGALLEETREQASMLLNELEEIKKGFSAHNSAELLERARRELKESIGKMERGADPVSEADISAPGLDRPPVKGDTVLLRDIGREAVVLDVNEKSGRVYVVSGAMKLWTTSENLAVRGKKQSDGQKKTRRVTGVESRAQRSVPGEIDLRGMAADEAILELDRYIDSAVLSGITTITVIHGKGTGVLRKAVQAHLRAHQSINTYRSGVYGEGENGVTIAEIKE